MGKKLKLDYPGAISELEKIMKKFNLKKKIYRLLFRGRGLEFEQFRTFDENEDDADSIDWAASLKSDKLLARQYKEESDINFYFVMDASKGMLFGSGKKLKAECASEIILALSYLVISSQDRAGLIMTNSKIVQYLPPKNLKNCLFIMEDFLSDIDSYEGNIDMKNTIDFLLQTIKNPRSIVIFVSDFLHIHPEIERDFNLLANKCEVIALVVKDKLDFELPKTSNPMTFSNSTGSRTMVIDTSIAEKSYKLIVEEQVKHMKNIFREDNIDFLELEANENFVIPLINFLQQRSKDK